MPKFRKTIKTSCFYVAWLTLFSSYQPNVASAHRLKLAKTDTNQDLTVKYSSPNLLVDSATGLLLTAQIKPTLTNVDQSQPKQTKSFSASFLLILLVSCGIFYPLFLFYRKLLGKWQKKPNYTQQKLNQSIKFLRHSNRKKLDVSVYVKDSGDKKQCEQPSPRFYKLLEKQHLRRHRSWLRLHLHPDNLFRADERQMMSSFETSAKTESATVSKLQIAFSPQALKLREKLSQISCSADSNQEDLVDLLCKTLLALVSHQNWTHVNHSSIALALDEAKAEFDFISQTERKKCLTRELSLANHNYSANSDSSATKDDYRYVVVTLILWTTHNSPLFTRIHTEAQLIEELAKLSKMRREFLHKFELLWNPQQQATYLNNQQLLIEYSDLNRLL